MRLDKLALFVAWIAACSANQDRASRVDGNSGGSAGSSDGGTIGVGGSGAGSSTPCTSDADCPPSSFCGKTNVCVPDGRCISDGDCTAPQTCGKASGTCLDPGSCVGDGDCAAGSSCKAGKCEIGTGCGQSEFAITQVAPNAMLLVDRSGSMDGDAGGDTRWNVAKKAVETVTTNFNDRIRFGLSTYSSCLSGGCSAGSIVVPIADQNAAGINGFLATTVDQRSDDGRGTNPDGTIRYLCDSGDPETSTGKSLSALVGEPSLQDAQRTNIVILLTDGAESGECTGGCDAACAAQNLLMQPQPVKTYVVGLGLNQGVLRTPAWAARWNTCVTPSRIAGRSASWIDVSTKRNPWRSPCSLEVLLLEHPRVVVAEAVDPDDRRTLVEQRRGQMRSDEARGPRDERLHAKTSRDACRKTARLARSRPRAACTVLPSAAIVPSSVRTTW